MKLNDLLAAPEHMAVKMAVETPDNNQIEQDFGRLAYAFLKDRAAGLIPHLIGFEVVEQEPDGSRAVGLFGFRIGESFYYVPAFFLSNQIKGMDLMYSKEEGNFVPLRESWINHILNKKTMQLGTPASEKDRKDFETPDFSFLGRPPLGGTTKLSEDMRGAVDIWNKMQQEVEHMLQTDPKFASEFAGAIQAMTKSAREVKRHQRSELIDYLEKRGGPNAVAAVLSGLQDVNFLKAATSFYDYHDLMVTEFDANLKPAEKQAAKIKIVTECEVNNYSAAPVAVGETERMKIVRDGFSITDNRDAEEKSEVYDVDYLSCLGSPTDTAAYDLMLASGAAVPVFISMIPYGTSDRGKCLVIDPESRRYMLAPAAALYVREGIKDEPDISRLYKDAVSLGSMTIGNQYVLVNEKGEASLPFRAKSTVSEAGDTVRIEVKWQDHNTVHVEDRDHEIGRSYAHENRSPYKICTYQDSYLMPTQRSGELKRSGNNVVVPTETWKAYKLEETDQYNDEDKAVRESFKPATYADVTEAMLKMSFHDVKVSSNDGGLAYMIQMNGVRDADNLNLKDATVRLVTQYAFPVDAAEAVLKEASTKRVSSRLVKLGQVIMPNVPPQTMAYDSQLGVPVQPEQMDYVDGQTYGVPQPNPNVGPGSGVNIGGEGETQQAGGGGMPPDVTQLAQQAAQSGQQSVFDHGVIGGLSRMYDTTNAIDGYVPEIMKALDRVGRILFLFYWKNEDFAERYGDQDLTELEDHLRAVFKSLGDLVLKLKQKTIDAEEAEYVEGGL